MHTGMIGIDFTVAPLTVLEAFYCDGSRAQDFLRDLPSDSPLKELVILSTCNRTEIYYAAEEPGPAKKWLVAYAADFFRVPPAMFDRFYWHHCDHTVQHLFRVGAGIQSMVVGENEILGQLKAAYNTCQKWGSTGSYLNKLFQTAISVGKRVRDETGVNDGAYSVSSIAIEAIGAQFNGVPGRSILIIGAGAMSERALKRLTALGRYEIHITNRSQERADALAKEYGVAVFPYKSLQLGKLPFDVLYFATHSKTHLLHASQLETITSPMLVVDIAVPRNVDPAIGELSTVRLVTIDDLKDVASRTLAGRQSEITRVEDIIQHEAKEFTRWYDYRKAQSKLEKCLASSA